MPVRLLLCTALLAFAAACGDGDSKQAKATATARPAACTYKPDAL